MNLCTFLLSDCNWIFLGTVYGSNIKKSKGFNLGHVVDSILFIIIHVHVSIHYG